MWNERVDSCRILQDESQAIIAPSGKQPTCVSDGTRGKPRQQASIITRPKAKQYGRPSESSGFKPLWQRRSRIDC